MSTGHKLEVGDWACAPSGATNRSAEYYPEPNEFNGFRFVEASQLLHVRAAASPTSQQLKPSKITDVDNSFFMWGTGRMAWYVLIFPSPSPE